MTKYIWICKQSWVYAGKNGEREKRLNMCLVPLCCDYSILTGVLVFTCIYSKKNIKHYRWNVCPLFLKKHGKKNLPNLTAISLKWTTDALKAIVGKIYGKSSLFCNIFSTKNMVNKKLLNLIAIVWTWPTECFWSDCGQNLWIEIFVLQHFFDQHMVKKHDPLNVFEAIVELMDRNLYFATCVRQK